MERRLRVIDLVLGIVIGFVLSGAFYLIWGAFELVGFFLWSIVAGGGGALAGRWLTGNVWGALAVPIDEKYFEISEVFISYSTTVPDDSGGYGYTIDPDNPTKLDDPIGAENYHTFRALAKSDFRIHVEVSSYDSGSFETISNQLWMGYVSPEE